ncbi:MAG TPA: GDP-mannose 4,6-dehydratase [Dehalococcoidia bacterium]|nr:GDP-mannose 4,6-dehydratase [Dehalococcoidia bacterium]
MPPHRSLITGAAGFLGSHLAESLLAGGETVIGTAHRDTRNVAHILDRMTLLPCDLLNRAATEAAVEEARPQTVYHLAAQSYPLRSWRAPTSTFRVNVQGTLHLLDALRRLAPEATVVVAGSSAEYGHVPADHQPITEDSPFLPASPYGVSKVAADLLAHLYRRAYGLKTVRVRPFFVIGPRKTGDVCSDFARGIVAVERGEQPSLKVGNVEAVRDFLHVADAVAGCRLLAEKATAGEVYNLCRGSGQRVGDLLEVLRGLATRPIPVEPDAARLRRLDEPSVIGDNSRLRALGWEPQIPISEALASILDYWRKSAAPAGTISHV